MIFLVFCIIMAIFSSMYADQRIRVPIIVDNLAAQDPNTGTRTFNITATSGNTSIAGSLGVTGAANLSSTLTVSGSSIIYDDFTVRADNGNQLFKVAKTEGTTAITANETVGGTLNVAGASTLTGNTTVGGTLSVTGASSLAGNTAVGGSFGITGDVAVNTNKFNVTAATGNTSIAGTLAVAGNTTLTGILHANGGIDTDGGRFVVADASGNTTISGKLDVTSSTSLDGIVVLQNDVIFGTRTLADVSVSTTRDLLQITLPDVNNYIGIVDVTYVGDMANNSSTVSNLEIFTTKYLVSRMDKTLTATVARISESYYNVAGGMSEPSDTSSIYSKSLGCDYNHAKSWVPNPRTVTLRYLPPTQNNRKDINATVLYEIRSGGPAGGPNVGLAGLWAR